MRLLIIVLTIGVLAGCLIASDAAPKHLDSLSIKAGTLLPNTLCAKDERIIFSCPVKRPAKIVSICASKDLTSEHGYLQYRFGLPGKIELEFPKERTGTQEKFHYTHYFRAQFDLTEIDF